MIKKWKFWRRFLIGVFTTFLLLFTIVIITLVWYQDKAVQKIVNAFNDDFRGAIVIGGTDISPFANFPYVSIVIENVQVYEDKADMFATILEVSHIYLGFNFWTLLGGNVNVNLLKIENGYFDIVRYLDGSFNLANALSGEKKIKDIKDEYNIELQKIELTNLDIIKYDEGTNIHAETYIESATSRFKNAENTLMIGLESQFILNVIIDGDSTIFKNKHFDANTELDYNKENGILTIHPSKIKLKNGVFGIDGSIDVLDDFNIDLKIHGNNPNFNLLIAFAPEELIPTLEQYENAGKIFFDATIKGKSMSGYHPAVNAEFGCDSAYFSNPVSNKKLEQIAFRGNYTNGEARDLTTMEFVLENVTAKPEAGTFLADLRIKNFESPEIDMSVTSNFDLDFLAKFLNVTSLQNLDGDVSIKMNFRDIIDLQNPEKSLEEFSQSYFSELEVKDLTFKLPEYHLTFDSIDIKASMDGNHANIEYFFLNLGNSDVTVRGEIDDLPAIIHQTSDEINANLFIYSSLLNIKELTSHDTINKKPVDEIINNMRLDLAFKTTARAFTESSNLPVGDFFIKNFYAKLKNYPHTLRKFNAHVIVGDEDLDILEFNGKIDKSDFQYAGRLYDYPVLLKDTLSGTIDLDFSLKSNLLRLDDLFAYNGENYVPEDYRNEEINDLDMYGNAQFYFEDSLKSTDIYFDQLNAGLKVHSMEIEDIHGKFKFQEELIMLNQMSGNIGNTDFIVNMKLYLGDNDSIRKSNNMVALNAEMVDFDQLSNYTIPHSNDSAYIVNHDSVFNIYELPFTDMVFDFEVDELNYHRHQINELNMDFRIQKNHFIYIDTLLLQTAGGNFNITGYFDGSNHDSIYFYPDIKISNVNMDQMLYRFENFGQDQIVSENLHGRLSGSIKGKVHMHPDMVPLIGESEIQMELEIVDGELKNYKPLNALSDYFKNKNLSKIRFDTLSNKLNVTNGIITIPSMTINSTLGYMDISGTQDMHNHMEYYFRIPMKMVTKTARHKLFGKKGAISDSTQIDVIHYKYTSKKTWYLNLKLIGDPDDFKVSLGRKK